MWGFLEYFRVLERFMRRFDEVDDGWALNVRMIDVKAMMC